MNCMNLFFFFSNGLDYISNSIIGENLNMRRYSLRRKPEKILNYD